MTAVEVGSTFDINKLTYSDGEDVPETYTLLGTYTRVFDSVSADTEGNYFFDSIAGELKTALTFSSIDDWSGIVILAGYAGPSGSGGNIAVDKVSAATGWNITSALTAAGPVVGQTVTNS